MSYHTIATEIGHNIEVVPESMISHRTEAALASAVSYAENPTSMCYNAESGLFKIGDNAA